MSHHKVSTLNDQFLIDWFDLLGSSRMFMNTVARFLSSLSTLCQKKVFLWIPVPVILSSSGWLSEPHIFHVSCPWGGLLGQLLFMGLVAVEGYRCCSLSCLLPLRRVTELLLFMRLFTMDGYWSHSSLCLLPLKSVIGLLLFLCLVTLVSYWSCFSSLFCSCPWVRLLVFPPFLIYLTCLWGGPLRLHPFPSLVLEQSCWGVLLWIEGLSYYHHSCSATMIWTFFWVCCFVLAIIQAPYLLQWHVGHLGSALLGKSTVRMVPFSLVCFPGSFMFVYLIIFLSQSHQV